MRIRSISTVALSLVLSAAGFGQTSMHVDTYFTNFGGSGQIMAMSNLGTIPSPGEYITTLSASCLSYGATSVTGDSGQVTYNDAFATSLTIGTVVGGDEYGRAALSDSWFTDSFDGAYGQINIADATRTTSFENLGYGEGSGTNSLMVQSGDSISDEIISFDNIYNDPNASGFGQGLFGIEAAPDVTESGLQGSFNRGKAKNGMIPVSFQDSVTVGRALLGFNNLGLASPFEDVGIITGTLTANGVEVGGFQESYTWLGGDTTTSFLLDPSEEIFLNKADYVGRVALNFSGTVESDSYLADGTIGGETLATFSTPTQYFYGGRNVPAPAAVVPFALGLIQTARRRRAKRA